jgi:hypothetical protein
MRGCAGPQEVVSFRFRGEQTISHDRKVCNIFWLFPRGASVKPEPRPRAAVTPRSKSRDVRLGEPRENTKCRERCRFIAESSIGLFINYPYIPLQSCVYDVYRPESPWLGVKYVSD